jgi:hypothetical protein
MQETLLFIKDGLVECNKAVIQVIQASNRPLTVESIGELQAVYEVLNECSDKVTTLIL